MNAEDTHILIVDDERPICENGVRILAKIGLTADFALSGQDALRRLQEQPYAVVVTDLKMHRMGGLELLQRIRESFPDTLVVVITGYASVASAVEVMKTGAFDYLPKPFTPQELRAVVQQALDARRLRIENRALTGSDAAAAPMTHQMVGRSAGIAKVIDMVAKVSPTDATVLIQGESGTGKELVARAIHANSTRSARVFFAVDCGTLSSELLESELFGHRRGAFTGAHRDKPGIFQQADGGTVFLDEISNIGVAVQGKLLRFLESREFLPVGAETVHQVDVRLIFATNRDLEEMVRAGTFREDFYYRIDVYPIMVPRLSERREDILPIAYHFLELFNRSVGKRIKDFEQNAAARLRDFHWPGNVRQLRNVIERAVILCEGDRIGPADLPLLTDLDALGELMDNVPEDNAQLIQVKKEIRNKAVVRVERSFIVSALSRNDWNVTRAATQVGMQRTNFQNLMKKHGVRIQDRPANDENGG
ncbi:MAG: sigma-54 dependent transcriptional regulator [Pseudomonadota bacterium]